MPTISIKSSMDLCNTSSIFHKPEMGLHNVIITNVVNVSAAHVHCHLYFYVCPLREEFHT